MLARKTSLALLASLCLLIASCGEEKTNRRLNDKAKDTPELNGKDDLSKEKNLRAKILDVKTLSEVLGDELAWFQDNQKKSISELNMKGIRCTLRQKDLKAGQWPSERDKDDELVLNFLNQATDATGINHIYLGILYYENLQVLCSKPQTSAFNLKEVNLTLGKYLEFYIPE